MAKNTELKSAWNVQTAPPFPSEESVPSQLRPFFSYILWRNHEATNGAGKATKCAVLTDTPQIREVAASLSIPVVEWAQLQKFLKERVCQHDERAVRGQVESDFDLSGLKENDNKIAKPDSVDEVQEQETHLEEKTTVCDPSAARVAAPAGVDGNLHESVASVQEDVSLIAHEANQMNASEPPSVDGNEREWNVLSIESSISAHTPAAELNHPALPSNDLRDTVLNDVRLSTPLSAEKAEPVGVSPTKPTDEESELDSDEEIIVFNPRSKRVSGARPRTPGGPVETVNSRPATRNGPRFDGSASPKPPRSPLKSTLKPQSPIFTPGQLYAPVGVAPVLAEHIQYPQTHAAPARGAQKSPPKSPSRSPLIQPASTTPNHQKSAGPGHVKAKQSQSDEARRQQSELIIQRQREAIQRQVKATTKPAPRKIQMEPTDNPTVIDPDDFDRSFVVQPAVHNSSPQQTHHAHTTQQRQTHSDRAGSKRRSGAAAGAARQRPASRGNPSHAHVNGQKGELEDDFVLKSGAPRGATRGKGKLFVP